MRPVVLLSRSVLPRAAAIFAVACAVTFTACGGRSTAPRQPETIADLRELGLAQRAVLAVDDVDGSWGPLSRDNMGSMVAAKAFHEVFDHIDRCAAKKRRAELRRAQTALVSSSDRVSGSARKLASSTAYVLGTSDAATVAFGAAAGECAADSFARALSRNLEAAPGVNGVSAAVHPTAKPTSGDDGAGYGVELTVQTADAPAPVAFALGVVRAGRVVSVVVLGAVADPFDVATRDLALTQIVERVNKAG